MAVTPCSFIYLSSPPSHWLRSLPSLTAVALSSPSSCASFQHLSVSLAYLWGGGGLCIAPSIVAPGPLFKRHTRQKLWGVYKQVYSKTSAEPKLQVVFNTPKMKPWINSKNQTNMLPSPSNSVSADIPHTTWLLSACPLGSTGNGQQGLLL